MDANAFISRLKANERPNDLVKVYDEYKTISGKLPAKDRGPFSLNVLCIISRNLEKVPSWKRSIDNQTLLSLSIDCVRETRVLDKGDRVKTLACIYHIHRHAVRQTEPIPPELILKMSFMPFELDSKYMLQEYYKTYWNILADRLTYIERLKTKVNIIKLIPKLTEDIQKVIDIFDPVQFCSNILIFLIKKLHCLYNELHAKELAGTFVQIFTKLSSVDLKLFKNLTEKDMLEMYIKLNECLYVIAENASKVHFEDANLDIIVRTCIAFVGNSPDLFHCLQTFYLNSFCSMLSKNTNLTFTESVLNGLLKSFETTERLGYKKTMYASYPFLCQFLRLFMEYNIANYTRKPWKQHFDITIQEKCLELIQFFMKKLKHCEQLQKCENCTVKSGLHDSLRLSFLIKHFITVSLSQKLLISTILPLFCSVIQDQYAIMTQLNQLECSNYQKYFRKLQTDVHNTAISLNKSQHFETSIILFDIYLQYEIQELQTNTKKENNDYKNISRALYNKSICELDCKMFDDAIIDAFLSLIFSGVLDTDKYMNLVMDIKAKELKARTDDIEETEEKFQVFSVLDACQKVVRKDLYGELRWFMSQLKFSDILNHEFQMYAKLWPSLAPIGGVWRSLRDLSKGKHDGWVKEEDQDVITRTLYEVILQTPTVVRTIHSEYFTEIVKDLLGTFDKENGNKKMSADLKLVQATLLFLQFEYDLAEASQKYGWKSTEPLQSMDPDQVPANRTIPMEHAATRPAIQAVRLLTDLLHQITQASTTFLSHSVKIYQVFVPVLLHLYRVTDALQLAYICCGIADIIGDDEIYIRNAGILLYNIPAPSPALDHIITLAGSKWGGQFEKHPETSVIFVCDAAIYYARTGAIGTAARLVQLAQARILNAFEKHPDMNMDVGVGRVLEAQAGLCGQTPGALTVVNHVQRHYLAANTHGTRWHLRRQQAATVRLHGAAAALAAARLARALLLARARAAAAAAAGLRAAAAARRALLYADVVDTGAFDDAQFKIDARLKHTLGLQPTNETQHCANKEPIKLPLSTPRRELETMLDNMVLKKTQISPSLPCVSVPSFKTPDFFDHSNNCECYACEIPICFILACKISSLEASMYFRANEIDIAKIYFDGALKMFDAVETRLKTVNKNSKHEDFIAKSVALIHEREFGRAQLEMLIELSFLELKTKNFELADGYIVKIHEIIQEIGSVDQYLSNEVMNLMTASAQLKNIIRKPQDTGLEVEFDSLNINYKDPPQTPINKGKMPKPATKKVVKDEDVPKKRKVIKLNLDDSPDEFEKPAVRKKAEFKLPNPSTKHLLEEATPRPRRPAIKITAPSEESAKSESENDFNEFHTPIQTPEQFLTPMTSVKTYAKKTLRSNIVKNLEKEFSTPKTIDKKSFPVSKKKDGLKRATSPGKLAKENDSKESRPRRLRQVKLDIDDQ